MSKIEDSLTPEQKETLGVNKYDINTKIEKWNKFRQMRYKMFWMSKVKDKDGNVQENKIKIKDMLDIHLKRVIKLIRERSKSLDDKWYTYTGQQWIDTMTMELKYRNEILKETFSYLKSNKPKTTEAIALIEKVLEEEMKELESYKQKQQEAKVTESIVETVTA